MFPPINQIDASFLFDYEIPQNTNKKFAVIGQKLQFLSPEKLASDKAIYGRDDIISLILLSKIAKNYLAKCPNPNKNVLNNYQWINKKIAEHNNHLKKKVFWRVADKISNSLSKGKISLKCEDLEDQIAEIQAKHQGHQDKFITLSKNKTLLNQRIHQDFIIDYLDNYDASAVKEQFATMWPLLPIYLKNKPRWQKHFLSLLPLEKRRELLLKEDSTYLRDQLFLQEGEKERRSILISSPIDEKIQAELMQIDAKHRVEDSKETDKVRMIIKEENLLMRAHLLMAVNDDTFLEYFSEEAFLDAFPLDTKIAGDQKVSDIEFNLLLRLLQLDDEDTLIAIRKTPLLGILLEREKNYAKSPGSVGADGTAVDSLSKTLATETILKAMTFVRQNRHLMTSQRLGAAAKSRPWIRKISKKHHNIPFDLEYDTEKGNIIAKLGLLGTGKYKIVKKEWLFSSDTQVLLANGKQAAVKKGVSEREVQFLTLAKGLPHVIQLLDVREYYSQKKQMNIQSARFPFYNMGMLDDHLKGKLSQKNKIQVAIDIVKGLQELHSKRIIHRDLKPANIFLQRTLEGKEEVVHAFIGDLGLSCLMEGDIKRKNSAGSPLYRPYEEIVGNSLADFETDAYALGVTLSELFFDTTPFELANDYNDLKKQQGDLNDLTKNPPPANSNSLEYLVWALIQPDKQKRMTLDAALNILENINAFKNSTAA